MYVRELATGDEFMQKALELKQLIRIVRKFTVEPHKGKLGTIVMQPMLRIDYSVRQPHDEGDVTWVFRETRPSDAQGNVDLQGTLLARLDKEEHEGVKHELVASGSA